MVVRLKSRQSSSFFSHAIKEGQIGAKNPAINYSHQNQSLFTISWFTLHFTIIIFTQIPFLEYFLFN